MNFGSQEWYANNPDDISKEIGLIYSRSQSGDNFPQGVEQAISICDQAKKEKKTLRIHVEKTFPKWTWTYTII